MSIKDIIFIIFLIAFGVTFHDWAGAQLAAGGIPGLLSLQGGWFGFAIMLIAFLVYRHFDMEATTTFNVIKDVGKGSLLAMGIAFLTIGLNTIKTDFEGGIIISGIGVACIL
ncbi:unnamed protein product, partial [marine sediment metagenome]